MDRSRRSWCMFLWKRVVHCSTPTSQGQVCLPEAQPELLLRGLPSLLPVESRSLSPGTCALAPKADASSSCQKERTAAVKKSLLRLPPPPQMKTPRRAGPSSPISRSRRASRMQFTLCPFPGLRATVQPHPGWWLTAQCLKCCTPLTPPLLLLACQCPLSRCLFQPMWCLCHCCRSLHRTVLGSRRSRVRLVLQNKSCQPHLPLQSVMIVWGFENSLACST